MGSLIDAGLFLLIGLGLRKMWRSAAVAGFVLYLIEQAYWVATGHVPGILGILLLVILFNGSRASFAYQRMRKANQPPPQVAG